MTFEEAYQQIRKHHYEILDERESISKSARLSLSTWVLDILTECRDIADTPQTERHLPDYSYESGIAERLRQAKKPCGKCEYHDWKWDEHIGYVDICKGIGRCPYNVQETITSTGSPIGDYRDGVGAWQTDCQWK